MISVGDHPTSEKPPEYDTVVLEPPCYDDAIKLNPANLLQTKYYQDISLPNYNDLRITNVNVDIVSPNDDCAVNSNNNQYTNTYTAITIVESSSNATNDCSITTKTIDDSSSANNQSGLS